MSSAPTNEPWLDALYRGATRAYNRYLGHTRGTLDERQRYAQGKLMERYNLTAQQAETAANRIVRHLAMGRELERGPDAGKVRARDLPRTPTGHNRWRYNVIVFYFTQEGEPRRTVRMVDSDDNLTAGQVREIAAQHAIWAASGERPLFRESDAYVGAIEVNQTLILSVERIA